MKKAFTLLEALIALAIAAGFIMTAFYAVNYHASLITGYTRRYSLLMEAYRTMEEAGKNLSQSCGNFDEPLGDFAYEIKVFSSPYEKLTTVGITVKKDKDLFNLTEYVLR